MADPSAIPPPPDPNDVTPQLGPASLGSDTPMGKFRAVLNTLSGGGIPAIQERQAADFAKRQQDAQVAFNRMRDATTYSTHARNTVSKDAPFGINVLTGKPATAEDVQGWHNDVTTGRVAAMKNLPKDAKPIAQKLFEVVHHITGHKGEDGPAGLPAAGDFGGETGRPSAIPAPPSSTASAAAPSPAMPPPPGQAVPPMMQDASLAAPENTRAMGVQNALTTQAQSTQQQNALENANIAPKAQAQTSADIAQLGQVAPDMAPEQKQNLLTRKLGYVPPPKMVTKLMADSDSPTGFSQVSYDQLTNQVYARQTSAPAPRGYLVTDTVTKDPYGNISVSTRTPITPGVSPAGGAGGSKPSGASGGGGTTGKLSGVKAGGGGPNGRVILPPLDSENHIIGVPTGYTPQSVEGANRLLDGAPTSDLPQQSRALSGKLARQYGWEQGKFTQKEMTPIREASQFINDAINNPALSVLDQDTITNAPLIAAARDVQHEGLTAQLLTNYFAKGMSPDQAEFLRMYNQLVGSIAGLSKLVRPGGTTEAQIERLRNELPNIVTSQGSNDARQRLMRLQKEIDVAMAKGNFGSAEALKPTGRTGSIPPPPSGAKKQFYRLNGKAYDAQTNQEIRP